MKTILMTLLILVGLAASAQKFSKVDKSPLDICYYPNEFDIEFLDLFARIASLEANPNSGNLCINSLNFM